MSEEFFQDEEVKQVLTSRAEFKESAICISGEDIDGVHYKYSSEYLRWNLKAMWVKKTVNLTEDERKQWFIDNPRPVKSFRD